MTKKRVTSIDVARLAGVSQPTVSRAFDPHASIAPQTRARVLETARHLGYTPNVIASSLSRQRTDIVGIIMANLTASQFYPRVLDLFTARLQAMRKQVLLFNAPPDRPVDEILPRVIGYQVDALIIASTTPGSEIIEETTRSGRPVILFNRFAPGTSANAVCCDNLEGGRLAADLLMNTGHGRIAFVAGIQSTATNIMREQGFTGRLRERGYQNVLREQAAYSYESGRRAARRLLAADERPDAVFCAADITALGLLDTARDEFGLRIPQDLSVIGFDDIPVAGWPAYKLTTIRQPVEAMVDTTLELLGREQSPASGEVKLLPVELIRRSTVADRGTR